MALSKPDILKHLRAGNIVIHPYNERNLANCSYDVTLGANYYRESKPEGGFGILNPYDETSVRSNWKLFVAQRAGDITAETGFKFGDNISPDDRIILLGPGETILGHTNEFIGGRRIINTEMKSRSSMARNFIAVCKCAGWGDIGYIYRWTMEITNFSQSHPIPLVVGRRIGQMIFFEVTAVHESDDYSVKGKYQTTGDIKELEAKWKPEDMLPKMWKDWEVTDPPKDIPEK